MYMYYVHASPRCARAPSLLTRMIWPAGIDSLAATDLVARLRVLSGVPSLPPTMALEHPTVRRMAAFVLESLGVEESGGQARASDIFGFSGMPLRRELT